MCHAGISGSLIYDLTETIVRFLLHGDKYNIKYFDAVEISANTSETPPEFTRAFILYLALNWDSKAGGGRCAAFYFEESSRKRLPSSEYFDTGGGNGG